MMKYSKRLNWCDSLLPIAYGELGSLSLTTLFSTASGVLFVLLFYNLSSYVGSRSAITETARAASRCITPTNGECVDILSDSFQPPEQDWFKRIPERTNTADVNVRTFRYQASMPSEHWGASFSYYQTNIGEQRFDVNSQLIPVKNFYAKGAYEIPSGIINSSYNIQGSSQFSPKFNPNFPAFEQDRDQGVQDWKASQRPFEFIENHSGEVQIGPNRDYAYTTPLINVPVIPMEAGATCNGNCNTSDLAGGSTNSAWKNYAFIAIKAFSRIRAERNQTNIQWGERNNFAGLEVEVRDAAGQIISWNPEGTNLNLNWRCLGGSEQETVSSSWKGYNLWLRGPRGSNGGNASSAVCPGGVYQHDAIRVPRGGSFRVRAHLANTGNNSARAEISVLSYFDEYNNITAANQLLECEPRKYTGYDQETASCALETCVPTNCKTSYCPNQNLKTLSDSGVIKTSLNSCQAQRQSLSFSCSESPKTIPNSAKTLQTQTLAACSDSWTPQATASPSANQETICSWESDNKINKWLEVGTANCELAKAVNYSEKCETPFSETTKPNPENCKNLKNKLEQISQTTKDLNSTQILGAPKFGELAKYSFGKLENLRIANFWTNKDLQGNTITSNAIKQTATGFRSFAKKDGSISQPLAGDLINYVKNFGISAYNWEDFEKQANSLITPIKLAREDYQLSNVYPFNESETEEIYYGQTDINAGWDFQADCSIDSNCKCEEGDTDCKLKSFSTQEDMLRDFAAKEIPQAADSNYVFNTSVSPIGYKSIGKFSPGQLPELPVCYPTRVVCSEEKSSNDTVVYLGRSSTKPTECNNNQYCFSKVPEGVNLNLEEVQEVINFDLAKEAGMRELRKIVPFATLQSECGDTPACAEIDIDTSSNSKAIVQVRYNIPVGFPLSSILQKDSIQIIHEKEEVIERDFAGSNFYK